MIFLKNLYSRHFRALCKLRNPLDSASFPTNFIFFNSLEPCALYFSNFLRPISFSAQIKHKLDTESINSENARGNSNKSKKSSAVMFKDAVVLSEKPEQSESEFENENEDEGEAKELKEKLKGPKKELRSLKENIQKKGIKENNEKGIDNLKKKNMKLDDGVLKDESVPGRLSALFSSRSVVPIRNFGDGVLKVESVPGRFSALFSSKSVVPIRNSGKRSRREEPIVYKELPPNMVEFAEYLYKQAYFKDANFLSVNKFDAACFENNYGRDFLKHAAEKFGRDNQEIAKWLSGSELKKVALFGCPSLSKKTVFSAKTLRTFFKIPENTVCSKCVLKQSCKFVNQSVWNNNTKNLHLPAVMNVISLYALESVHPQLVVPVEIKTSVNRLLEEVVKLSQTVS